MMMIVIATAMVAFFVWGSVMSYVKGYCSQDHSEVPLAGQKGSPFGIFSRVNCNTDMVRWNKFGRPVCSIFFFF